MKIPKKLKLFGYNWTVKLDKIMEGGEFIWKTKTIKVSTKFGEQESILLHEIMEAILCELHFRFYGQEKNMEYRFIFDHSGLSLFHKTLYQALKDNNLI